MASLETGRVCMKVVGRESGGYCVVLKGDDGTFATVTGPKILTGVKRRKANVLHLEPTQYKIDISEDASDEQVANALDKAGLTKKLGLKMKAAHEMKAHAAKEQAKKPSARAEDKPAEKKAKKK